MLLDDELDNNVKSNSFEYNILILIFHGIITVAFGVRNFENLDKKNKLSLKKKKILLAQ